MDQGNSTGSRSAEKVTPASTAPEMGDIFDELAADIKASVKETSAKVAEIHRIRSVENEFQRGYNAAVFDIAAKIREL